MLELQHGDKTAASPSRSIHTVIRCNAAPTTLTGQKVESHLGRVPQGSHPELCPDTVYRHVRGLLKSWHGLGWIAKRRALILVKDLYRPYRHTVYTRGDIDLVYHQ